MISTIPSLNLERTYEIRMPQMINSALSENWLWKELGDMHWELLGKGLGMPCADLKDANGNRIYPTFVRILLESSPLTNYHENSNLWLHAQLERYGESTCISTINGSDGKNNLNAKLMTVFSGKGRGGNARLYRQPVFLPDCKILDQKFEPEFLMAYRLNKRSFKLHDGVPYVSGQNDDEFLFEYEYRINSYSDINGVGLLYFAAYPMITDYCESVYFEERSSSEWNKRYATRMRDVSYFANCEPGDAIMYRLNSIMNSNSGDIVLDSMLYRKSDGAILASLLTHKSKAQCNGLNCSKCMRKNSAANPPTNLCG